MISNNAEKKIKILFVTGNENKKKEVQQIMGERFQVDSLAIDCTFFSFRL